MSTEELRQYVIDIVTKRDEYERSERTHPSIYLGQVKYAPLGIHPEPDHECVCLKCHPELTPPEARQSGDHVAVRFGDHGRMPNLRIYLDGHDVTTQCFEALIGEHGTVWLWRDPVHACKLSCDSACIERREGVVQVTNERKRMPSCRIHFARSLTGSTPRTS